jgi:hypothetical protein
MAYLLDSLRLGNVITESVYTLIGLFGPRDTLYTYCYGFCMNIIGDVISKFKILDLSQMLFALANTAYCSMSCGLQHELWPVVSKSALLPSRSISFCFCIAIMHD